MKPLHGSSHAAMVMVAAGAWGVERTQFFR